MKLLIVAMARLPSTMLLSLCLFYLPHQACAVGIKRRLQQHEESLGGTQKRAPRHRARRTHKLVPGVAFGRDWHLTLAQLLLMQMTYLCWKASSETGRKAKSIRPRSWSTHNEQFGKGQPTLVRWLTWAPRMLSGA